MPKYKTVIKKYGKLPAKIAEERPLNKLCVDIIIPHKIRRKGKETLIPKSVTTTDPVTRWCKVTKYSDKTATMIANLVETTWMVQYPRAVEVTYDQVG